MIKDDAPIPREDSTSRTSADKADDRPPAMTAALAGLATLAVAMGIGRFAFTPILPMMIQDAGLTITAGSWLASVNYLGYLLGALSATVIRVRPESAIPRGLLAITLTTLAMGWPLPFPAWLVLRLLAGIASAWLLIAISGWCLETLAVYRRPFLNSVVFAGVGTGIAVAGLMCIALIHAGLRSGHAWAALGLLSALVTAIVWRRFRSGKAAVAGQPQEPGQRYRWNGVAARAVFSYGLFGFGYIIPATFLPVMAKTALQGGTAFAWSWPLFGAAAALSTLTVAPLVRYAGDRRVWIASQLIMAFGVALPAFSAQLLPILIAALCVGGTFMVITLVALQEARRIAGAKAPALVAAMVSAFAAGQILGPLTVSAEPGGFSVALIFAALLLAGGAILLMIGNGGPTPASIHSRRNHEQQ